MVSYRILSEPFFNLTTHLGIRAYVERCCVLKGSSAKFHAMIEASSIIPKTWGMDTMGGG